MWLTILMHIPLGGDASHSTHNAEVFTRELKVHQSHRGRRRRAAADVVDARRDFPPNPQMIIVYHRVDAASRERYDGICAYPHINHSRKRPSAIPTENFALSQTAMSMFLFRLI